MSIHRVTPHKPKREKKNERDINLKKEVEKLKRQVTKLRKELGKRAEAEEDAVEETAVAEPIVIPSQAEKCPECGSDTKEMDIIGKFFVICPECKWKRKAA